MFPVVLSGCVFTDWFITQDVDETAVNVNVSNIDAESNTNSSANWQKVMADYQPICLDGETKPGPWDNNLSLAQLDLATMTVTAGSELIPTAGVPSVVADVQGRLIAAFQWFSCDSDPQDFDKVGIAISEDGGQTWSTPVAAEFSDLPDSYQRPFDPTLVLLSDGRLRMYFTSTVGSSLMLGQNTDIFSAISSDGIHYSFEPGVRFDLVDAAAYDSAVGYVDGYWHLMTPSNTAGVLGQVHHARSVDGLTFEQLDDITLTEAVNWTGNFLPQSDGLYFFGTPHQGKAWWTKTTDGETWSTPSYLPTIGGDPAVACATSSTDCVVISVTAGANQLVQPLP
jgi:hypothetical protein